MNLFADDFKINKPLRLIELFAGYGSQAMAFDKIGVKYEHWFVCEFDKYAIKSYNAVHNTNFDVSDIRQIKGKDLKITDTDKYCYLMTYSFPCTDLSVAGKMKGMKKGSGTKSGLLWEVERLLNEVDELPQVLFMENVPQVISRKNMPDFIEWLKFLAKKGYSNIYKVLNAKDYGVPQNRKRCFMFSFLGDYDYEFPQPVKLEKRLKDILESEVGEKYYLKNEKSKKLIADLIERDIIPSEQNRFTCDLSINRPRRIEVANCITTKVDAGISNFKSEGNCVFERFTDIAATLTAENNELYYVETLYRIRKLTPLECFRLMGVTEENAKKIISINSNTQCYKQAGNSIVVDVMAEMFKKLF